MLEHQSEKFSPIGSQDDINQFLRQLRIFPTLESPAFISDYKRLVSGSSITQFNPDERRQLEKNYEIYLLTGKSIADIISAQNVSVEWCRKSKQQLMGELLNNTSDPIEVAIPQNLSSWLKVVKYADRDSIDKLESYKVAVEKKIGFPADIRIMTIRDYVELAGQENVRHPERTISIFGHIPTARTIPVVTSSMINGDKKVYISNDAINPKGIHIRSYQENITVTQHAVALAIYAAN